MRAEVFAAMAFMLLGASVVQGSPPQYTVTDLGWSDLGTTGSDGAKAINQSGQVALVRGGVVGVWANGQFTQVGALDNSNGLLAINNLGDEAGTCSLVPFMWRNGVWANLPSLQPASAAFVYGLNNGGIAVGTTGNSRGISSPVMWQNGVIQDLGTPGGVDGDAFAINNLGQIVGVFGNEPAFYAGQGFIWQSGTMSALPLPSGYTITHPVAISDSGDIVGWTNNSIDRVYGNTATLWSNGSVQLLTTLPGEAYSQAFGLNNKGVIVGMSFDSGPPSFPSKATLWEDGQVYDINDLLTPGSGWTLSQAVGVNDAGQIIGSGYNGGQPQAFLLTPVPEPSVVVALLAAAFFLMCGPVHHKAQIENWRERVLVFARRLSQGAASVRPGNGRRG